MPGKQIPQIGDAGADSFLFGYRNGGLHQKSHVDRALRQRSDHVVERHHAHYDVGFFKAAFF
jgi:hypothetical protein